MTTEVIKLLIVVGGVFAIPVGIAWFDHRNRMKGLEMLRVYAERGEEPPASVLEAVILVSNWGRKPTAPRPWTRGRFLSHAAPNFVFACGFAALAWWRFSTTGQLEKMVVIAAIVALWFLASLAAHLVGAYYAPDK
jgi:hypothetical protein